MYTRKNIMNFRAELSGGSRVNKSCIFFQLLLLLVGNTHCSELEIKKIEKELKRIVPVEVKPVVSVSPVSDVFEVIVGNKVFYVTEDLGYLFRGDLIDLKNKKNLTDIVRQNLRAELFSSLDRSSLISFRAIESIASAEIYVFTDIDCTYCQKFHREVPELNSAGVAVHYLAFPRKGMDSEGSKKAESVWCSENSPQALTDAKLGKKVQSKTCHNPIKEQFEMGIRIGVMGTPAVYASNGVELGGYLSAQNVLNEITP